MKKGQHSSPHIFSSNSVEISSFPIQKNLHFIISGNLNMNFMYTNQIFKDTLVRYYKQSTHELLLSSSCHSVLFRGYIDKRLQLINPLIGYNSKAEMYYERISQAIGVRLQVLVHSPSIGVNIADFLNELSTCQGAVQDMIDFIETLITVTCKKDVVDTVGLYKYSFHYILTKLQEIERMYKNEYLSVDLFDGDLSFLDDVPTQQEPFDFYP